MLQQGRRCRQCNVPLRSQTKPCDSPVNVIAAIGPVSCSSCHLTCVGDSAWIPQKCYTCPNTRWSLMILQHFLQYKLQR